MTVWFVPPLLCLFLYSFFFFFLNEWATFVLMWHGRWFVEHVWLWRRAPDWNRAYRRPQPLPAAVSFTCLDLQDRSL